MSMTAGRCTARVLGTDIDTLSWRDALMSIKAWAEAGESRYVCICNVHSVVTAHKEASFQKVLNDADMATADGAPVAWTLRRMGHKGQERINGPDLFWKFCSQAKLSDAPIFLYGSLPSTLELLGKRLQAEFPELRIAGAYSPPFRVLSQEEDEEIVRMINASGAGTIWISLGCPKQERWMAAHRGRINAVMLGVGAAFDYHAGTLRRAPVWMRNANLEWLYRLLQEPKRLWRRYFDTNTYFIKYTVRHFPRRPRAG